MSLLHILYNSRALQDAYRPLPIHTVTIRLEACGLCCNSTSDLGKVVLLMIKA